MPPASVSTSTLTPTTAANSAHSPADNSKPPPVINSLPSALLAPTSPRLSEDSYDLVESKAGTRQQSPSPTPPASIAPKTIENMEAKATSDDGDDSDWE